MKKFVRGMLSILIMLSLMCPALSIAASAVTPAFSQGNSVVTYSFPGYGDVVFTGDFRVFDYDGYLDQPDEFFSRANDSFMASATLYDDYDNQPTVTEITVTKPSNTILTFHVDVDADYDNLFAVSSARINLYSFVANPDYSTIIMPTSGTLYNGNYTVAKTIDTFYIYIVSPSPYLPASYLGRAFEGYDDATGQVETEATFSNINLTAPNAQVTVAYDSNFDICVGDNSTPINSDYIDYDVTAVNGIKLSASIASGAGNIKFLGWYLDDPDVLISDRPVYTYYPKDEVSVIHARYYEAPANKDRNAIICGDDEHGYHFYTSTTIGESFANALADATENHLKYIIPLKDMTLPANMNYTIPSGTTLLIPFDDQHTCYTEDTVTAKGGLHKKTTGAMQYRRLTLGTRTNITVESGGSICVCATPAAVDSECDYDLATGEYIYKDENNNPVPVSDENPTGGDYSHNGPVYDYYGLLMLGANSKITLKNGSNFYAWGFVTNTNGTIIAESGSNIYEYFQINDFRGGSTTLLMLDFNQFPFNQYYVQNIESKIEYHYGSVEKVYISAYVLGAPYSYMADFIGYEDADEGAQTGFFRLMDDDSILIRTYNRDEDKVYYNVVGQTKVTNLRVELTNPLTNEVLAIDSVDYYMPISNINVVVESGSEFLVDSKFVFLPGSSLVVDEGAALNIITRTDANGDPVKNEFGEIMSADVIFADKDSVATYSSNEREPTVPFKPSIYFPQRSNKTRKWETTENATLDNNGVITVSSDSSLRTTSGAVIKSSAQTGEFNMGRTNYTALDVYDPVGKQVSTVSVNHTTFSEEIDGVPITMDLSGSWFGYVKDSGEDIEEDEYDTTELDSFNGAMSFKYDTEIGAWGNFKDVYYYPGPDDSGEPVSYENMNIAYKLDYQKDCAESDSFVSEYSVNNDRGVRESTNVYADVWIYEPEVLSGNYNFGKVKAHPLYTTHLAKHTVTFYDTDGVTKLNGDGDEYYYGEVPSYTPAVTEKIINGKTYTFAGWIAETLADPDDPESRTFENGVFYARGDSLPAIHDFNDPNYLAVYKQCFEKHSLTLGGSDNGGDNGDISANFYINIPSSYASHPQDLRVRFRWGKQFVGLDNNDVYQYSSSAITEYSDIEYAGGGFYRAVLNIAAKEMSDTITATLMDKRYGSIVASENYSAAEYLYNLINYDDGALAAKLMSSDANLTDETAPVKAAQLKDLCRATLAYGASAQINFNYNINSLPDADLDLALQHNADGIVGEAAQTAIMDRFFDITDPGDPDSYESILWDIDFTPYDLRSYQTSFPNGVGSGGYYGSSLTLESAVSYNLYFRYSLDPVGLDFTDIVSAYTVETGGVHGADHDITYEIVPSDADFDYYDFVRIDINNIAAADLTKDICVTFNNGSESVSFTVNPGIYFYNVLDLDRENSVVDNLKSLVCNIYNYNQKAVAYFS